MESVIETVVEPGKKFAKDSIRLVKKCTKPDRKEYQKIAFATAVGFAIMGFIGFFVKLVHIPISKFLAFICVLSSLLFRQHYRWILNDTRMKHNHSKTSKVVVCFSGKRKSGKDFVSFRLHDLLKSRNFSTTVRGISYPLKEEYAQIHNLDAERLKSDSDYKERVRLSMVEFGEKIRCEDPTYFCRRAIESIPDLISMDMVIISDCRRPSDLHYFRSNFNSLLIRIDCTEEVRQKRGFVWTTGIDDAETECALDEVDDWDLRLRNDGDLELLDRQLNELISRVL
ncbi:Phosphomevalonate kinase [Aphelenchoides besseyi]|nr:Phosphomevalonate kinase [Aphelenchoides besseyi]KAI6236724.1 Phosphomevalonate kinase [Aphelenchoides besseyi]